jgi:hypothetical protein
MRKNMIVALILGILVMSVFPGVFARSLDSEVRSADLNHDGIVDKKDLDILLAFWDTKTGSEISILSFSGDSEFNSPDVNGDEIVNMKDLLEVLSSWGPCDGTCPADLNRNHEVESNDVKIVEAFWGMEGKNIHIRNPDLNTNGIVDTEDLVILLSRWTHDDIVTDMPKDDPIVVVPEERPVIDVPTDRPVDEPFKGFRFSGKNAEDVMIDGMKTHPDKSLIKGYVKHNKRSDKNTGRVKVDLQGFNEELDQRLRVQFNGEIDKITRRHLESTDVRPATAVSDMPLVYDMHASAKYLTLKKGHDRFRYENAEVEFTYAPHTGEIDVHSVTGTLVESDKPRDRVTDRVTNVRKVGDRPVSRPSSLDASRLSDVLPVDETEVSDISDVLPVEPTSLVKNLLETHAMGFE